MALQGEKPNEASRCLDWEDEKNKQKKQLGSCWLLSGKKVKWPGLRGKSEMETWLGPPAPLSFSLFRSPPHFSPSTPNFPDLSLPLRQSVLRVSSDIYLDFFHSLSIGIGVRKTKIKIKKEGVGMWTSLPPKVAKSGQLTSLALKHCIQIKKCGLPHHCGTIGFCFVFVFLTSVCHWV